MDNCPSVSLRFSRINVSRSRRIYTIAPCYWVVKVTRHVHRKLQPDITVCSRKHQRAKSRSGWPSRRTGLNTPRIVTRSPSRLPKKEHRIASGLVNHASERCCAQPLALPLAQSYIKYTDVTRASCSSFPLSAWPQHPHRFYVFTRSFGRCKPIYRRHSDPTNSQAIYYI